MLRLHVLGGVSVDSGGAALGAAASQRKAMALLSLLAASGARGLSRDKLVAYLWPESPADKATHRLTQLLYSLRRDLRAEDLFLGTAELHLNRDVVSTDLSEFTAALEAGDFASAAAAYGGPFLDGFFLQSAPEFEHWVEAERTRLGQHHAAAVESLAREASRRGDHGAAAGWWRQLSHSDPLNARTAVSYMEALCAVGDRAGALRFARSYETLLRVEFDTEPDPSVAATVLRLRVAPATEAIEPLIPAIAVLPFENLTPDRENQYFSDGMTEEITNVLARVPGLRVASRTSASALTGRGLDARQIAEALGVGTLVEGSVRKVGNRIRVAAQLVNAADGCALWSETYDRTLDDVFALQDELARAIALALPLARTTAAPVRFPRPTTAVDAYTLFLRGRYATKKRTSESLALAIEYFEQAVEIDPAYAQAHAGLAESWSMRGFGEFGDLDARIAMPKAKAAALRALELDPQLVEGHVSLGVVHFLFDWDWAAAEAEFRRAAQRHSGESYAELWYAIFLGVMGRHEESLRRVLYAEGLQPTMVQVRLVVGRCYYFARRYEQARECLEDILRAEPGHVLTICWLMRTLCALGRPEDALRAAEKVPPEQRTHYLNTILAIPLAALGRADEARPLCDATIAAMKEGRIPSELLYYCASVLALLGEDSRALDALEECEARRCAYLPFLRVEQPLHRLRNEPRFIGLLTRLRLLPDLA